MELKECMGAVEAMLFAHAEPVSAGRLAQALDMLASKLAVRLAKKHGNITL